MDADGNPTATVRCETCGATPDPTARCRECGKTVGEMTISHGTLRTGLHRTRIKQSECEAK